MRPPLRTTKKHQRHFLSLPQTFTPLLIVVVRRRVATSGLSNPDFSVGQIWKAQRVFTTFVRVGNTFDEGHGFSRAVKTCLLDGFSR